MVTLHRAVWLVTVSIYKYKFNNNMYIQTSNKDIIKKIIKGRYFDTCTDKNTIS